MTKSADYSTTIIYKITCRDSNITDKYVGHTTDLVRRRQAHKNNTCNENSAYFNQKLYKFIRDNGGWDKWKMEIVAYYNCNNIYEAKQREQEHYLELGASLNSMEPYKLIQPKNEVVISNYKLPNNKHSFICEKCDYACSKQSNWNKHVETKKHLREPGALSNVFICEMCDYKCCKQFLLNKHNNTNKHKTNVADAHRIVMLNKINPAPILSLQTETPHTDYTTVISQLFNQNNKLQNFITEQAVQNKKETSEILNKMVEQSNEHRREIIELLNCVNVLNKK